MKKPGGSDERKALLSRRTFDYTVEHTPSTRMSLWSGMVDEEGGRWRVEVGSPWRRRMAQITIRVSRSEVSGPAEECWWEME